ncbi:MAG: ATP-binding cassette domain-containing protein [Blautia sp.]|nr:ATP-binding cassette domain-containing protein [Blautia sp.]
MESKENIIIKNASTHNLKSISVSIPLNKFTCVTGVSGGGKSSLVYDTLYAESQREFLECMTTSTFGEQIMDKPLVESITNLRPALRVSQQYYNHNPRSTVGTLSNVSHYLRSLFALVINFEENTALTEASFSPNDIDACCPHCKGLGDEYVVDMDALIPDWDKSLKQGGIRYYSGQASSIEVKTLEKLCEYKGIDLNTPICKLSSSELDFLLHNTEPISISIRYKTPKGRSKQQTLKVKGAIIELEEQLKHIDQPSTLASISKYLKKDECHICHGSRFSNKPLDYRVNNSNVAQVEAFQMPDLKLWISEVREKYQSTAIGNVISALATQIDSRITNIIDLNLPYLSLSRSIPTLSGGELQRLRIAIQLGCSLAGLLYILDEPCRGLHERNVQTIVKASKLLVDKGNTVISIEHNSEYISSADRIIELGPVGGPSGGYIVSDDVPPEQYRKQIHFSPITKQSSKMISFKNVHFHNIDGQNVSFPLNQISCITGVSGSGKSSLMTVVEETLSARAPRHCESYDCYSSVKKVVRVNQRPIGKTPRSTILSYLELSTPLRNLFANTDQAKRAKLTASSFSINTTGGRCETCSGTGYKKIELNYLPDSYITCPDCNGKRFLPEVLSAQFNGKNITEYLDAPISQIIDDFTNEDTIYKKLSCMLELGLGYLSLGQMSMNLSGGEAQRIKLAKALSEKKSEKVVYLLDEPTVGLHDADISRLKEVLIRMRDNDCTIIMVEHNLGFIAEIADYMVDFGIKAGHSGGKIISCGTPEEVCRAKESSWYDVIS